MTENSSPDPFESLRRQAETLTQFLQPAAVDVLLKEHLRIQEFVLQPAIGRMLEANRKIDALFAPAMLRLVRQNQERVTALFDSSALRILRDDPTRWGAFVTPEVIAQVDAYQDELIDRVADASNADSVEDGSESGAWFGALSWTGLLWEIEGIIKALEVLTAGLTAANMLESVPPTVLIALLLMLCTAAEFALWLAKGPSE
ncbi:MAG: hypothetical protein ACYC0H_15920 [Solirubrobacteraceae bacterium]